MKTVVGGLASGDPVTCSCSVVVKPDMSLEDAVKQVQKAKTFNLT